MDTNYVVEYVPSTRPKKVQGTKEDVYRKYKGQTIVPYGKGGGNWLVEGRNADILVNGESRGEFVRKHYNQKLSPSLAKRFEDELKAGIVVI